MGQKKTLQSEEQRFVDLTIAADDMGWRSHLPPAVLLRPLAVEDLHFLVSVPAGCTKKKARQRTGGPRSSKKRLEPEGSTEVNAPGRTVGPGESAASRAGITKTSSRRVLAGVVNSGIDTGEVLMVEDVQHGHAEFK